MFTKREVIGSPLEAAALSDFLNVAGLDGVTSIVPDQLRSIGVKTLLLEPGPKGQVRITSNDLRHFGGKMPPVAIEATLRILRSTDLNAPAGVVLTVRPTKGTWLGLSFLALSGVGLGGYDLFQNPSRSGLLYFVLMGLALGLLLQDLRSLITSAWPGLLVEARRLANGSLE